MKKKPPAQPWRDPILGPCACSQLRRATRAVSAFYDKYMASAGLTITQYALLVNIARAGSISRTALASALGMERTTLTRNLRPLERDGLVAEASGDDRRQHLISLTTAGRRRLAKGFQCWTRAQQAFLDGFGATRLAELRQLLGAATDASKSKKRTHAA